MVAGGVNAPRREASSRLPAWCFKGFLSGEGGVVREARRRGGPRGGGGEVDAAGAAADGYNEIDATVLRPGKIENNAKYE